ncbi:MAG: hypothetical protein AB1762_20420 [Gemmatimonadota bacterium]
MTKPPRPSRLFIVLTFVIVVSLGLAAYLINFPVVWIAVGGTLVMLGLAWRVGRPKQPHQSTTNEPSDSNVTQQKPESALGA